MIVNKSFCFKFKSGLGMNYLSISQYVALKVKLILFLWHGEYRPLLEAELMFVQIPYVILEQYVQIGKKLQVVRKNKFFRVILNSFSIFFTLLLYSVVRKMMTFNMWIMTMKYHSKKVWRRYVTGWNGHVMR